jgi:hypothetical protein
MAYLIRRRAAHITIGLADLETVLGGEIAEPAGAKRST